MATTIPGITGLKEVSDTAHSITLQWNAAVPTTTIPGITALREVAETINSITLQWLPPLSSDEWRLNYNILGMKCMADANITATKPPSTATALAALAKVQTALTSLQTSIASLQTEIKQIIADVKLL